MLVIYLLLGFGGIGGIGKKKKCSRFLELMVGLVLGTNISHYPSAELGRICNKQVN
jgi:hypothetical protein